MAGIFHSYDIRMEPQDISFVPIDKLSKAVALYYDIKGVKSVVIGKDPRLTSTAIRDSLAQKLLQHGIDVVLIEDSKHDVCSSGFFYYVCGLYPESAGLMVTASHLPAAQNGIKVVDKNVVAVPYTEGLNIIEWMHTQFQARQDYNLWRPNGFGRLSTAYPHDRYVEETCRTAGVGQNSFRGMKLAVDLANSTPAIDLRALCEYIGASAHYINERIDGTFPGHDPNPMVEANLAGLTKLVREINASIGVTGDCDYDRIGMVDEQGKMIRGDHIAALIAESVLKSYSGHGKPCVLHDLRASRVLHEVIKQNGGIPEMTRVGHSYIKTHMRQRHTRETPVLTASELSNHMYFMNDGIPYENINLAILYIIRTLAETPKPLSARVDVFKQSHYHSGEINFEFTEVSQRSNAMAQLSSKVQQELGKGDNLKIDTIDGVLIEREGDFFVSFRESQTEPVLRLVCESRERANTEGMVNYITGLVQTCGGKVKVKK